MKVLQTILSLVVILAPIPASAQQTVPSIAVPFADLNLQSDAGVRTLDRRLRRAVRSICGDDRGTVSVAAGAAIRRCATVKQAEVTLLRNRAVAASHASRMLAGR